jgi:hypothetical protein
MSLCVIKRRSTVVLADWLKFVDKPTLRVRGAKVGEHKLARRQARQAKSKRETDT